MSAPTSERAGDGGRLSEGERDVLTDLGREALRATRTDGGRDE